MVATARRSCALTRTSSSGVFFFTCSLTASTACATSAFSPIATDGIVSASAGRSSINHHQQGSGRGPAKSQHGQSHECPDCRRPMRRTGINCCACFAAPAIIFLVRYIMNSDNSAPPPICPQNQAPRRRAIPLGPGHTERPTVCIESAKIASDRPAICPRRSPDQAKIRSCHRCTRRIRYRRQTACSTISITAPNNPRLTSIRLM